MAKHKDKPAKAAEPPEHPADKATRLEGEKKGAELGAKFAAENSVRMAKLISTYPDADAEELLYELREEFWGTDWKPKSP